MFGWEPRGVVLHQVKYPSVQEVIATAKAAGAVLVFAHPTVYKSMPLVRQLAKEGIIDGIEVDHPRNSPEDKAEGAAPGGHLHHRRRSGGAHSGAGPQAPGHRSVTRSR